MSTTTATIVPTGTWSIDPAHSTVGFSIKHLGIASVRGRFERFEGSLTVGEDGGYAVKASVEAASINTNEPQRDEHLRSPEFFNAEAHPQLTIESTSVQEQAPNKLRIDAKLTMAGITKDVTLEATVLGTETDPWGNRRVGLELRGEISRADYGMTFNQPLTSGGFLLSDTVKMLIDVELVRQ